MRLYIDTSVFGVYFEKEFQLWTRKLIDDIFDGDFVAVVSDITLAELETAPQRVRNLANKVISENAELSISGQHEKELAEKYLKEKIVTEKFSF